MRINHNIQALNAYRQLSQNQGVVSKHLERLSSGLRINRAADDAAGLAISEKMRSQIRGLNMAERNTLDGISLIQTAEGSLNTSHDILQRMRELAVQAANGTLEEEDRAAIQNEIDQLTFELDRIAETTQFNAKKLLRGATEARPFAAIGASEIQYVDQGEWQGIVHATPTSPAAVDFDFDANLAAEQKANLVGQTFVINGLTYELYDSNNPVPGVPANTSVAVDIMDWNDAPAAGDDNELAANIDYLATQLLESIRASDSGLTGSVTNANVGADATDGLFEANTKLTLLTTNPMTPNDANQIGVSSTLTTGFNIYEPNTTNAISTMHGDPASANTRSFSVSFGEVPKDGDYLVIDSVKINFGTASSNYNSGSKEATIDITNKSLFDVLSEINSLLTNLSTNFTSDVEALTSHAVVGNSLVLTTNKTDDGTSNGLEIEMFDGDFAANVGQSLKLGMQIGANASENMEIEIDISDAASLGLAYNADGTPITTAGLNAVKGIDVSTESAAQHAITVIERAIIRVSEIRSKLGAYQNRMEHTINNLGIAAENLTAAESRIRDADMAKEMTDFTKNNIINQAATAMLAQANQLPQGILQLLK